MSELCKYGCGQIGKFVIKSGGMCCDDNVNKCPEQRRKNSESVKKAIKEGRLLTGDHVWKGKRRYVTPWNKGKTKNTLKNLRGYEKDEVFKKHDKPIVGSVLKKWISREPNYIRQCECCKNDKWLEKPINLDIHHINGDNTDNRRENLQMLCPNCHSFTDTYKGNKKTRISRINTIPEETIINAIKETVSIDKALEKLGLPGSGCFRSKILEFKIKYKISQLHDKYRDTKLF